MHLFESPIFIPIAGIAAGCILGVMGIWKKIRESEMAHERDMRQREMDHQRRMKELEQGVKPTEPGA